MAHQKRLDPLQSRRKTLQAINVFQSRMLRIEPDHNITINDDTSKDDCSNESNNDEYQIFPTYKWQDKRADPETLETRTLNNTKLEPGASQVMENSIEEFNDNNDISESEHGGAPAVSTEQHYEKPVSQDKNTDSGAFNVTYDREVHNYNSSDEDSSKFSKTKSDVVSKDVMLSPLNGYDDDLQLTSPSGIASTSLIENPISPHSEMQCYQLPENSSRILSPSPLEEKTDVNSPTREIVSETKHAKIEILEDCNLVLDPATGYFCRSFGEKTETNITRDIVDTEIILEMEKNKENRDDTVEFHVQELPENSSRKRKRRQTNPFYKSCMDFRDASENEDFSVDSSDEWSAKESGEDSSSSGKPRKHKKKKKKANSNDVKQEAINFKKNKKINVLKIRKNKKDKGESYETKTGKTVEAKSLQPNPCLDGKCKRSCKDITEERRQNLFKFYWDLSVQRRKDWLLRCCQRTSIKRKKTTQDISRRTLTYEYFLNNGDDYVQICQKFLLKTLDITQRQLLYVLANETEEMSQIDQRRSNVPIKYNDEVVDYAKQYIESLPAVPSHYCRPNTNRVYLPQEFKNISNLYQLYLKKCREEKQPQIISEKVFRNLFTGDYNIGFHVPKKDRCVMCTKFENLESGLIEAEAKKMKEHIEEKKASYARFKLHQNMNDPETITASFDLQKVLMQHAVILF